MTSLHRWLFSSLLTLAGTARLSAQTAVPGTGSAVEQYEPVFAQLQHMVPRSDRVAPVHEVTLRRDAIVFHLLDGSLIEATAVDGRTIGLVFLGHGRVTFAPQSAIERMEFRRVLGDSMIDAAITAAAFLFTDSTSQEVSRQVAFGPGSPGPGAADVLKDALHGLLDGRAQHVDQPTLMAGLLNGSADAFFYAQVKREHGEDLMFMFDPRQDEQVQVLRHGRRDGQKVQIVAQFNAASGERLGPDLAVDRYQVEATIAGNLGFSATTTTNVTALRTGTRWLRMLLFEDLVVDSIHDQDGAATFFRDRQSSELWVRLNQPPQRGESRSIRISYHGGLIGFGSVLEQLTRDLPPSRRSALDRWLYVKDSETWFPRYAPSDARYADLPAAAVELTFHAPKRYRLASIGRLVESREEGNMSTTRWVSERPVNQICFNLGEFEEFTITDPRIPPVTVQINAEGHRLLGQVLMGQNDPQGDVGHDVSTSLAFFASAFGPPLLDRYYATEVPFPYGQAFPGLMYLSMATFLTLDQSGNEEVFRAHEMAHQWWGIGVEPAGYRDAWLSEGFADYSGLWFMQVRLNDPDKFLKQLRESRQAIRARRDAAPPIGLGWRVTETGIPDDYSTIVYRKGAWVLQMLRVLMRNLHTGSDSVFVATMQDYYREFRGRRASTSDFQQVVERHMGQSMGWFFNEWIDGTAVPTYVFSWHAEPTPEGQFMLRLRVRQENAPGNFLMPVPLEIVFADSAKAFVRVNVNGPLTEGSLLLPAEPKRLELNPMESVLAEVKTERWQ